MAANQSTNLEESQGMSQGVHDSDRNQMNVGVNLLLVGKTGSGISSTCKSIDSESQAKQLGGFVPVSSGIETGRTERDGTQITVVATPGLRNKHLFKKDLEKSRIESFQDVICEAFQHAPRGFKAVVLVLSYTERIDHEYTRLIAYLKCVLGENALQDHGILLVTRADCLCRDQGAVTSITDWGKTQTGFFKELYDQCQSRCVLFDCLTDSEERKESQLNQLMLNVDRLDREASYTYDAFSATNKKFVNQGDSLSSIKNILLQELKWLDDNLGGSGLNKMDDKMRDTLLARKQCFMDDAKKVMRDKHRITHISSLKKTIDSLGNLIELTAHRTPDTKEFNERMKKFKSEFDETFSNFRVPVVAQIVELLGCWIV